MIAQVIRFEKEKEKNKNILTDEETIKTDGKYAYVCIITYNVGLSCEEIIRLYEMRLEIEEDFRKLKDFFGIFEQDELLDLYADLTKEKRQLLKNYLVIYFLFCSLIII